jgi:hypothetical protein
MRETAPTTEHHKLPALRDSVDRHPALVAQIAQGLGVETGAAG